jgi:serine/threonine protein kinase
MHQIADTINSRWKLLEELSRDSGQGNTFIVSDNLDVDDRSKYVIKLLKIEDPKALVRFEREIKACFALKHRNIVKVKDSAYEDTPTPYLVTEYCSGRELTAEKIRNLPTIERLRMFEYICEAIAHAHREGVIHRDIKPGNIFLENLDSLIPIVGDFGLCFFKGEESRERPTATRGSIGNWEFGPPEGHMGRQNSPDESFDVYNLGRLLYWLLSSGSLLYREYFDRAEFDLRTDGADHVVHLAYEVIARSVNEDPARRYATAAKMLEDVKELIVFAEKDGRYLDCGLPQSCVFCRVGNYHWEYLGAQDNDCYQFAEYGLSFQPIRGVPINPRILFGRCGHCGNVQQFRLDTTVKWHSEWKNVPPSPHAPKWKQ